MNRVIAPIYTGFTALTLTAVLTAVYPFSGQFGGAIQPTIALLTFDVSAVRFSVTKGFTATSGSGHLASANWILQLEGSEVISAFNACATVPTGYIMAAIGYK